MREGSCEDTGPTEEASEGAGFHRTRWEGPGNVASLRGAQTCLRNGGTFHSLKCFLLQYKQQTELDRVTPHQPHWGPEASQAEKSLLPLPGLRGCFLPFGRSVLPRYGWATRPERRRI